MKNTKKHFYALLAPLLLLLGLLSQGVNAQNQPAVPADAEKPLFALYEKDGNMSVLMQDEDSGRIYGKLYRDKEYADKELSVTFSIQCVKPLDVYIDVSSITDPINVGTVTFKKGETVASYSFNVAKSASAYTSDGYNLYYLSFTTSEDKKGFVNGYLFRRQYETTTPYERLPICKRSIDEFDANDFFTMNASERARYSLKEVSSFWSANYYALYKDNSSDSYGRIFLGNYRFFRFVESNQVNLWIASGEQSVTQRNDDEHVFTSNWIREKMPTLYEEGSEFQFCRVCGERVSRSIPKLTVDITKNKNYGKVNFTVVDNRDGKTPVSSALLTVITADQGTCTISTDANGKASAILPVGKNGLTLGKSGYISRTIRFTVKPGEQSLTPIGIGTTKPIDAKLNVRTMDLAEIQEVGIDVTDPANQHVYEYKIINAFTPDIPMIPLNLFYNQKGEFIGYGYDNDSLSTEGNFDFERYIPFYMDGIQPKINIYRDDGRFSGYVPGSSQGASGQGDRKFPAAQPDKVLYPIKEGLFLIIDGEAKWLKEMFCAELMVFNHSLTDTFENVTAELRLPDGLSFAAMKSGANASEAKQTIEKIDCGDSDSFVWYIRGDKEGEYDLSGVLDGLLMPFEEAYHEELHIESPIKVYAGSALHMTIFSPAAVYYGKDCTVKIEIQNVSESPIYYFTNKILGLKQCRVSHYADGKVVETVFLEDDTVTEKFIEVFAPGDKLIYEINTNILFKSDIVLSRLKQLYGQAVGLERLIDFYRAFEKATGDIERLRTLFAALAQTTEEYADGSTGYRALAKAAETLTEEADNDDAALNLLNGIYKKRLYGELTDLANQTAFVSDERAQELAEQLTEIAERAVDPAYDTSRIFAKLRDSIMALPMRFVLRDVVVATLSGSTTQIPYTYEVVPDESESYADFVNISATIRDLCEKVAGSLDVPLLIYRRTGILGKIAGEITFNESAYFAAKCATGKTQYRVWVEKDGALDAETITLSADTDNADYQDGILSFTGSAYVELKTQSQTPYQGTLFVELTQDGKTSTRQFVLQTAKNHTCAAKTKTDILNKEENYGGFSVKTCDVCGDIIDVQWETPFEDVSADDWYFDSVKYVNLYRYMNGTGEQLFEPDSPLTRAMLVTALYRMDGSPTISESNSFSDVEEGSWCENAIAWAKQNHLVNGYSETIFAPDDNITREQMAAILYRYAIYKRYDTDSREENTSNTFEDQEAISDYAVAGMRYAVNKQLMNGKTSALLMPQDETTRAELAAILFRFASNNG